MKRFSVKGAPSEYILDHGVLNQLESKLLERDFYHILFVHGKKSWEAAKPFILPFTKVKSAEYTYDGENSIEEIEKLSKSVSEGKYDAIVGVGGGKVLDLVKAASNSTRVPHVLIPTLASNCAPWTPLGVVYDSTGKHVDAPEYPVNSSLVLVEPEILVHAPIEYFIAGIADTLAKWYEADVQMAGMENKPVALEISYFAAKKCKDNLLEYSEEAIEAVKKGEINDAFIKVVETIIMLAGMVGGFADHYGRTAAAHAIHNGLTVLPETHSVLHGDKVAYGILIQLNLENKWEEIKDILPFYQKLKLPITLHDLGVTQVTEEEIMEVAEISCLPQQTIHVLPGKITPEIVKDAMLKWEEEAKQFV